MRSPQALLVLLATFFSWGGENGADAVDSSFPLARLAFQPECTCELQMGMGWSPLKGACMKGEVTTCLQCSSLMKCSQISTLVGDGVQAFRGDCRSLALFPLEVGECESGKRASIANVVSMVIDDQDNIYIADHGNNRIRMYSSRSDIIVTIAGSGGVGFGGDGGLARFAMLRGPEGIALKPMVNVTGDGVGREVYFSDYLNQRIRKVVKTSAGWMIYTVAGTGTMGENPLCDTGCDALTEATLWNPRALAFSSTQDLYFVDSGARKIRKLTPGSPGIISTFAGRASTYSNVDMSSSFGDMVSRMLTGSFMQSNDQVQMRALYFLNIDHNDNVWFVDSTNARILMSPLSNLSHVSTTADFGSYQKKFFRNLFQGARTLQERTALAPLVAQGLKAWLPVEFPEILSQAGSLLQVVTEDNEFMAGQTYWRWAQPASQGDGGWCPEKNIHSTDACQVSAQSSKFFNIMSFCFDPVGSMFLSDSTSSQVAAIVHGPGSRSSFIPGALRTTTKQCRCMKYFADESSSHSGQQFDLDLCQENPDLKSLLDERGYLTPGGNVDLFVAQLPPCIATNYCADQDGYPEWCYVNQSHVGHSSANGCDATTWGFCEPKKKPPGIRWELVEGAVLGHEMRKEKSYVHSLQHLVELKLYLSEDLWLTNGTACRTGCGPSQNPPGSKITYQLAGTSILSGFVWSTGSRPIPNCTSTCCGLQIQGTQPQQGAQPGGPICRFQSKSDFAVLEAFAQNMPPPAPGKKPPGITTVWSELEDLESSRADPDGAYEDCLDRCMLDQNCKAFVARLQNGGPDALSSKQPCIFFSKNYPFAVYTLDRDNWPFENLVLDMSDPLKVKTAFSTSFKGPLTPATRLIGASGNGTGIWVSDGLIASKDVIGRERPEAGLLLPACEELCLTTLGCYGVAYPGCYLLNRKGIELQTTSSLFRTAVMVKSYLEPKVQNVAGQPEVLAMNAETEPAMVSYLNRPTGCVVNSAGDALIADTWNQRIRRVSGWSAGCVESEKIRKDEKLEYVAAIENISSACTSEPLITSLYTHVQREALENNNLQPMEDMFCNFRNASDLGFLDAFTNNTLVLCTLCAKIAPRPAICPWQSMCNCRDEIVKAATTSLYLTCPANNAYWDKWHRWITAYITCWWKDPAAATWLTNSTKRLQLRKRLELYNTNPR